LLLLGLVWFFCINRHWAEFKAMGGANTAANVSTASNSNASAKLAAPSLAVSFENGKYKLTGTVADEATKQKLIARAEEVYGKGNIIDEIKVGGVSSAGWLDSVLALLPFTKNGVTNGGLAVEGNSITLKGQVPDEATKTKVYKDAVAAVPASTTVNNLLTVAGQKALTDEQAKTQAKLNESIAGKIVEFESGKDVLTDRGKAVLDELVPVFKGSTDNLEVGGHTDSDGNDAANLSLSQRRAETVKKYLVDKGLDAARFTTKGYGETKPIADNNTADGKQRNRRIEFQVKGGV
jgi:OOP family OmpA-OmpF porin